MLKITSIYLAEILAIPLLVAGYFWILRQKEKAAARKSAEA
jgi:hypothetical protein